MPVTHQVEVDVEVDRFLFILGTGRYPEIPPHAVGNRNRLLLSSQQCVTFNSAFEFHTTLATVEVWDSVPSQRLDLMHGASNAGYAEFQVTQPTCAFTYLEGAPGLPDIPIHAPGRYAVSALRRRLAPRDDDGSPDERELLGGGKRTNLECWNIQLWPCDLETIDLDTGEPI